MPRRSPPPLALAYHAIGEVPLARDPHRLFVPVAALEHHATLLRRWGYRLVGATELARASDRRGLAAITFDDGFANNLALCEIGFPATVFVAAGLLGKEHPDVPGAPMLTREELLRLQAAGIEIGSHTHGHADLTVLDEDAARAEIERGRRELEELTGTAVTAFAYPFGRAVAATRAAAAAAGIEAAFRTSANGSWDDPLDLPRQDMENSSSDLGLWLKREDRYEPLARSFPGRVVRRAAYEVRTRAH